MEELINEEQPHKLPAKVLQKTDDLEAEANLEGSSCECEYGKFKTKEALLNAYANLEAEFTRKSQRLSELEKEKTEKATLSETQVEEGLSTFLEKNTEAKDYQDEIKEKVMSMAEDNPFENAWAKLVKERFVSAKEKAEDPLIQKYVLGDEKLREKVIELYLNDINSSKPPILLNSKSGQRATRQDPVAPTTLKEAKKALEDMFS